MQAMWLLVAAAWLLALVASPVDGWFVYGSMSALFSPSCPTDLPHPECVCFVPKRNRGVAYVCNLSEKADFWTVINQIYDHGGLIDHLLINGCPTAIGELGELPKLKVYHLAITNCGIKSIKPGAFSKSAFWLNRLELDYNELEQLDFGLAQLDQLAWLKVRHNRLLSVPSKAFALNKLLFNVNLEHNRIWWIAGDAFDKSTTALETLNLANNHLNSLPYDLIHKESDEDFKYLTALDLSGNHLQDGMINSMLQGYSKLAVLRISHNHLTSVNLPSDLKSLRVLDISHNNIKRISCIPIWELTSLNYLHAGSNEIESVDLDAIKEHIGERFVYIDLSHNDIKSLPSELLRSLCPSNLIANLENNWLAGDEYDQCNKWRSDTVGSRHLYFPIQLHNDVPVPVQCHNPMSGCTDLVPVLDEVKDMHFEFNAENWTCIPARFKFA